LIRTGDVLGGFPGLGGPVNAKGKVFFQSDDSNRWQDCSIGQIVRKGHRCSPNKEINEGDEMR